MSNIMKFKRGNTEVELDLTRVHQAESRIHEVAFVTAGKAPELLSRFNEAYLDASRIAAKLEYEHLQAKADVDRVRARLLMDVIPDLLKEKGISSSQDMRQAALDGHPEYQEATEMAHRTKCFLTLMKSKVQGLEMAYTAVKKILGENAFSPAGGLPLNNGPQQEDIREPVRTVRPTSSHPGFGKARYG